MARPAGTHAPRGAGNVNEPRGGPQTAAGTMPDERGKRWRKLIERAKKKADIYKSLWTEAYDMIFINRIGFNNSLADMNLVFDETAVVEAPNLASRITNGIFPLSGYSFLLKFGPEAPLELQRSQKARQTLFEITNLFHDQLRNSNFAAEFEESNTDLTLGTANMLANRGALHGTLEFQSVPLTNMYLVPGRDGRPGGWIRWEMMTPEQIKETWPRGDFSETFNERAKHETERHAEEKVWHFCKRDMTVVPEERADMVIMLDKDDEIIHEWEVKGLGSIPWLTWRWSASALASYGFGPALQTLPAVRLANLMVELILQNAQLALGGVYFYDDDGIFNPEGVILEPGTFVPRGKGSQIDALPSTTQFDMTGFTLGEVRQNIKDGFHNAKRSRPEGKTPPTATEEVNDATELAMSMGAITNRLRHEHTFRLVQRLMFINRQEGILPDLPKVDGKVIRVVPTSPLLRGQNNVAIMDHQRFMASVLQYYGQPAVLRMGPGKHINYLADLHGIPPELVPEAETLDRDFAQIANKLAEMMQAQQDPSGAR